MAYHLKKSNQARQKCDKLKKGILPFNIDKLKI